MFDIGWPELVVILMVAIVVIGPRDLPKAFYAVGKWIRAARRVTADFQRHVDDMVRETELEDLKKVATQARSFNVKNQIENAIDPTGDLKKTLELDPVVADKASAPTPSVPVGADNGSKASDDTAPPAAEPKPAAKVAPAKAAPAKTASKASPRVPSRVPKKKGATGAKSTASKTPTSEQAS